MKVLHHSVAGRQVRINVVENEDDVPAYKRWVQSNRVFSFDTESTDLQTFSANNRLRLAQFAVGTESWVLPVEKGPRYEYLAKTTLEYADGLEMHNATHDCLVVDRHLGVPLETLYPKTKDTGVLSRLVDSRPVQFGGHGHKLEELTARFIDKDVADNVKGSVVAQIKELRRSHKDLKIRKKSDYYERVPLDYEGYLLYAGMDPILTGLARRVLEPKVPASARGLVSYEHELALYCAMMERRGTLLDLEYTRTKDREMDEEFDDLEAQALEQGLENCNSAKQVAERFMAMGWVPEKFTDKGQVVVDKDVLADLSKKGYGLADIVIRAKRCTKWNSAYYKNFLDLVDPDDRIHPGIHTMEARTARMSVTKPALQTLPKKDKQVRDAFLAEEGHLMVSIDYSNMELRVMAARSGDQVMLKAFANGDDLHQITADAAGVERSGGKTGNFSKAFGGGAQAIADGAGVPLEVGQRISDAFDSTYKQVTAYSKKLMKEARSVGYITTMTGRRLYVDKSRSYSALNYDVQSSARDITGLGIVKIFKKGLGEFIRLPVHDEVVSSIPKTDVEEVSKAIAECMYYEVKGTPVPTDISVGERTWGSAK